MFYDPTFAEFIEIVGKKINPELPLFAQLYILKQVAQFYHVAWNKAFLHYVGTNFFFQITYFMIFNRYMFLRKVMLCSFFRIFVVYCLCDRLYHDFYVINRL